MIVTSEFTRRRLSQLGLVDASANVIVVEPGAFAAEPEPAAASPDGPRAGEPLRLLSVGSITPRKALRDAAQALGDRAGKSFHWTIAGRHDLDPSCAAELRGTIDRLGLGDRVRLTGEVEDSQLRELYQSAHVLLHPAHYEGFGMVITEAIAHGLPVIATTGGALGETLPAGAGVSYPPGHVAALGAALDGVLTDRGRLLQLRRGALAARKRLVSWKEAAGSWERARAALG